MRRIALLSAMGALMLGSNAVAAIPKQYFNGQPATFYNGKTSQGRHVHLVVIRRKLAVFRFTANYVCPGGTPASGEIEVAVPADLKPKKGSFSHTYTDANGTVTIISGKFNGKQVKGAFSYTFANGSATCKTGSVTYKAKLGLAPKPGQP